MDLPIQLVATVILDGNKDHVTALLWTRERSRRSVQHVTIPASLLKFIRLYSQSLGACIFKLLMSCM